MQGIFVLARYFFLGYSLGMDILKHTEHMRERLRASRIPHTEISRLSGGELSVSWLSKFGRGVMDNPSVHTLAELERVLDRADKGEAA